MNWFSGKAKKKRRISRQRKIPQNVRNYVTKRDKGKCVYCGKSKQKKTWYRGGTVIQFGHQIAFSKGGDNCSDNIQLECRSCNYAKGTRSKSAGWFNHRGVKGCKKRHDRPRK